MSLSTRQAPENKMSSQNEEVVLDLFALDPKDEAGADFVALVGSKLQQAFLAQKLKNKLTQQQVATRLNVDRSRIHRCLSGHNNLSAEAIGALVWALGGKPVFDIEFDDEDAISCNFFEEEKLHAHQAGGLGAPNLTVTFSSPHQSFGTPKAFVAGASND